MNEVKFYTYAVKPIHRLRGWDVRHKDFNLVIICTDEWFQAMPHLLNRQNNHPAKTNADTNIAYEEFCHATTITAVYFPALACELFMQ